MSDFFEPVPEPAAAPSAAPRVPWLGAPSGTLPGVVALEVVLARSTSAAVCVSRLAAYPDGFEIDVLTVAHPEADAIDPELFGPLGRRPGGADERLRLGVQFADGAKATNLGGGPGFVGEVPTGPVLRAGSGGGGGGNWRQSYWVWPLPPPGPLAFVCEWPAAGIAVTRHEIEARVVLDAARRAIVIFDDPPAGGRRRAASARGTASRIDR